MNRLHVYIIIILYITIIYINGNFPLVINDQPNFKNCQQLQLHNMQFASY
jgi:hypothetical protein